MILFSGLKKALQKACYVFCVLTLLYSLIMLAIYDTEANMSVFTVLLFYPLAFVFTACNVWLATKAWNNLVKALVRYVVLVVDIAVFICLPQTASLNSTSGLILFALVTVVYVIVSMVLTQVKATRQRRRDKQSEYQNVYGDVNRK